MSVPIRAFPGEVVELQARNKIENDGFAPSLTDLVPTVPGRKVKWTVDDHTLAEIFETSVDGHRTKVLCLKVGTPTVTAETDQGTFDFLFDIVDEPVPTLTPDGIYTRPLELRPDPA